jgi:hypothetical protein
MTIQEWTLISLCLRAVAFFPIVFTCIHPLFSTVRSRRIRLHLHTNGFHVRDFWLFLTVRSDVIWSIVVSAGVSYLSWVVS